MPRTIADNNERLDKILNVLNEALKRDPNAINELIRYRVACNEDLADHPTIQVLQKSDEKFYVGLLGIINGITEELTGYRVATEHTNDGLEEDDPVVKFVKYKM